MRYRTTFVVQIVCLLLGIGVAGAAQAAGAGRAVAVALAGVVVLPVMVAMIRRGYRREEERVAAMPDREAAALRLRAARNAALVLPLLVAAVVLVGPPGNPFGWLYVVLIVAAAGVAWRDWRRTDEGELRLTLQRPVASNACSDGWRDLVDFAHPLAAVAPRCLGALCTRLGLGRGSRRSR